MVYDVHVVIVERQKASPDARVVPVLVLLDLFSLKVSPAVEFYDQAFIDQTVHFSHAWYVHMHTDSETCPGEVCMGQHLQEGVGTRENQTQDPADLAIPVAGKLGSQEIRRQECLANCALHHDQ